jgi:hypothetical protein
MAEEPDSGGGEKVRRITEIMKGLSRLGEHPIGKVVKAPVVMGGRAAKDFALDPGWRATKYVGRKARGAAKQSLEIGNLTFKGLGGHWKKEVREDSRRQLGDKYKNAKETVLKLQRESIDLEAIIWVVLALVIWGMDRGIGKNYSGYDFYSSNLLSFNIMGIVTTSFIFFGFVYWRLIRQVTNKDIGIIFTIGILFLINILSRAVTGETFLVKTNWNYLLLILVAGVAFGWEIFRWIKYKAIGDLYYFIMALVVSYIWINDGWWYSTNTFLVLSKASWHFFFILGFGFLFLRPKLNEEGKEGSWCIFTTILLLGDFYGYSLLSGRGTILESIPLLTLFVIPYIYAKTKSNFAMIFTFLMFIIIIFQSAGGSSYPIQSVLGEEIDEGKSIGQTFKDTFNSIFGRGGYFEKRIDYAITGRVEENKAEPLGVYLENVKASDPEFFDDERVVVWGTVKARTLDDPVNLQISCYVEKSKFYFLEKKIYGEIFPKTLASEESFPKRYESERLIRKEEENFGKEIFTFEEDDFECRFEPEKLESGTNTIIVAASFNFETESYLKTYFIEEERKRAMVKEDIDIFDEFGITDKRPISVFTNGPISLSIGTKVPPTGISSQGENVEVTWVGVDLDHNINWRGSIDAIDELVILVPRGLYMDTEASCNREFGQYTEVMCEESCDGIYEKVKSEKEDRKKACKENCGFLFGSDSTEIEDRFDGYALNVEKIKKEIKDREEDIKENERFRAFRCILYAKNPSSILGKTPISTKYFRARARYRYTVEERKTVTIRELKKKIKGPLSNEIFDFSLKEAHNFRGGISWRINKDIGLLESDPDRDGDFDTIIPDSGSISCVRNLMNNEDYYNYVLTYSQEFGVPASLVIATICTENSALNERKIGDDGRSFGLMQILYTTAQERGVGYTGAPNGLLDADTNIKYGTKYIGTQKSNTFYDPPKVAAAYNPGSLAKCCSNLPPEEGNNCENPDTYGNEWCLFSTSGHIDKFTKYWNAAVTELRKALEEEESEE